METSKLKKLLEAKCIVESHNKLMELLPKQEDETRETLETKLLITQLERDYLLNTIKTILMEK